MYGEHPSASTGEPIGIGVQQGGCVDPTGNSAVLKCVSSMARQWAVGQGHEAATGGTELTVGHPVTDPTEFRMTGETPMPSRNRPAWATIHAVVGRRLDDSAIIMEWIRTFSRTTDRTGQDQD